MRRVEQIIRAQSKENSPNRSDGEIQDRTDFGLAIARTAERALAAERLSGATMDRLLNILIRDGMINRGNVAARQRFYDEHGVNSPTFMVISPGKRCNLHCSGCYASSASPDSEKLSWDVFDRLVTEMHELWGSVFCVISGGEPLMYRDQGHDLLDMAESHPDMFFMFYTNGTLIDDSVAERIAQLGNIIPAISVEGMRERTDERRGEGTFDKVVAAMDRLYEAKCVYGISLTATCHNCYEILSDEFLDLFYDDHNALFGWIFQYMPIGRSFTLDLMPTPEQRKWMWEETWRQIRKRDIFLADFWNSATLVDGCLSSGRAGGYFYVDWNGQMTPCVFMPYSPVNVNEV